MTEVLASAEQQHIQTISPYERLRLGGDELAICGQITLAPDGVGEQKLLLLDVGFRKNNETGEYGPYDIDGTGNMRSFKKPYVLVGHSATETDGDLKTYEFDAGERVELGRNADEPAEALGFAENMHVSRTHASIEISDHGKVTVEDYSTNGTDVVSGYDLVPDAGKGEMQFGYTVGIEDYVHQAGRGRGHSAKEERLGWGQGVYEGRNIIARDTPINTGVYPVGGTHGEALVVDDKKYPEELNEIYEKVVSRLDQVNPGRLGIKGLKRILGGRHDSSNPNVEVVLDNVFSEVSEALRYDQDATDALASDYQKISMNVYLQEGVGVCRTQALLSAYLIERLVNAGKLEGRVSVDRNKGVFDGVESGHAWTRFTDANGKVYIIDPAQKFVGTLAESRTRTRAWDYRRTEDHLAQILDTRL